MHRRGKIIFIFGGVILILAGVFVGGFLVLRSETSQGNFFNTTNNSGLQQTAMGILLDELSVLNVESEIERVIGDNLTQKFLETITEEGVQKELSREELLSEEFFLSTVAPFLEEYRVEIFPEIKDGEINISGLTDSHAYFEKIQGHVFVLAGAWQKTIQVNTELINDYENREMFGKIAEILKLNDEEIRKLIVPIKYVEFQKDVLQLSSIIQSLIVNTFISGERQDPLRGMLAVSVLEDIQNLGFRVIDELIQIENGLITK